jgi:hypothetical protein
MMKTNLKVIAMISLYQVSSTANRALRKANLPGSFDYTIGLFKPLQNLHLYEHVADLDVTDLDHAFEVGNIGPQSKITRLGPMHSISCGDILIHNGKTFVVASFGFDELEVTI